MQLDLAVFRNLSVVGLALLITFLAILTKLVGCGIPALPLGRRAALQIGMGMGP
jgi:Kef-type K+ transport system membrane component KefB